MNIFEFTPIPLPLEWQIPPERWAIEHEDTLIIAAGERTDLFSSPKGDAPINNSPPVRCLVSRTIAY